MAGTLYCGDNLEVLQEYVPTESVDLVYLDPPFNSQRVYNIVYKDSGAQEEAFKDHWRWEEAAPTFSRLIEHEAPPRLRKLLTGLHDLLIDDDADLLAYLTMMTPRLAALHRTLKPTGSLYLHCDPTASHYLKAVLDGIFGVAAFQNEVIWRRTRAHNDRALTGFGATHDVLLYYSKTKTKTFNKVFTARDPNAPKTHDLYVHTDGKTYRKDNCRAPGNRGPRYTWNGHTHNWRFTEENARQLEREGRIVYSKTGMPRLLRPIDPNSGSPLQDIWTDIDSPNSGSAEMLGYQTQKPLALLDRILRCSSNPGDLVLDPFCGCGTTIEASERLGRRWIGIDIARKAVEVTEKRFEKVELEPPVVRWHPTDLQAAAALAERDPKQFEEWSLRKVRAVRRRKKDRGIDGEAMFREADGTSWNVLVSVKGGRSLNPGMVRDLRGTVEREKAPLGVLVSMHEPSKEMRLEATRAGFLSVVDREGPIPRLQIVTVARLFSDFPSIRCPGANVTEMPSKVVPVQGALPFIMDPATQKPANDRATRGRGLKPKPPVKTRPPGASKKAQNRR
ncbi:MAG: DNA methyltransferase [Deltaproteobacteria bacterium]